MKIEILNETKKEKKNLKNKQGKDKKIINEVIHVEQNDIGYWFVDSQGKIINDEFNYYNHYDGCDHDNCY